MSDIVGKALETPWPHQFTKNGRGYELPDGNYAQTYICVHCYQEYVRGLQPQPPNPCPARADSKKQVRRVIG